MIIGKPEAAFALGSQGSQLQPISCRIFKDINDEEIWEDCWQRVVENESKRMEISFTKSLKKIGESEKISNIVNKSIN